MRPTVLRTQSDVRAWSAGHQSEGRSVALVPTMGALHAGHMSLIDLAHTHSDRVIASIYVNPTQFGEDEDLDAYPRDEAGDLDRLAAHGCHAAFIPDTLYGPDHATTITVGGHTSRYEGANRPGHFDGVALVVAKLFNQVRPDVAVFGEKDYQQLALVRRMVADLDMTVDVVGAPIARDAHGLALSSRNRYFDKAALDVARRLNVIAREAAGAEDFQRARNQAEAALLDAGFSRLDYMEKVDAHTLDPVGPDTTEARLLVTARLRGVRLLDNFPAALP